jgi:uncharacterized membrane protein
MMADSGRLGTARSQLQRLGTLTDVVYAVALVLIIQWLPLPEESHSTGAVWLIDLWAEYSQNIIAVLIGVVFSIMYWIRSNTLMTALDRTDGVHTGLSIASVFFLLLLLSLRRVWRGGGRAGKAWSGRESRKRRSSPSSSRPSPNP